MFIKMYTQKTQSTTFNQNCEARRVLSRVDLIILLYHLASHTHIAPENTRH